MLLHRFHARTCRTEQPVGLAMVAPAQAAKTTLFAAGNHGDVRKSAAGDFFPLTKGM
jgi:hypothetical protein